MPRKKLTEKQEELLSLTTRVDVDLTQNQRIVLGCIIQMYRERSNSVEENGYVHASVSTLKKECGMGQDSIKSAITKLVNEGLITCEVGRVKLQNTRFSLTEKTKKYIYIPMDDKMRTYSVPMDEKVYIDQSEKIEALELKISELSKTVENLTEEVQKLNRYIGIGIGVERSKYNTINYHTGIEKESILTDTKEKDEVSGREDAGDGYVQPPVKQYVFDPRYFSNGKSEVDTVSVEGTITDDIHSDEVRETSPREKLTKAEIEERNNYITSTFSRLETKLNYLYSISDSRIFGDVSMSIADIFNDATEKGRWFTDKQWGKLLRYGDRYEKIIDGKQAYFNGTGKKDADAELTSTDEKPFTEEPEKNTTDNDTDKCGGVAPQQYKRMTKEELEAWVSEDVKKYPDFTSWQNALEAKLDRKFKGWQEGKHLYISCMYNFVTGMAAKHFNRLEIEKRAEKYSQPVSKPYGEINEDTGVLAENGTEPHRRFLRAFLPLAYTSYHLTN